MCVILYATPGARITKDEIRKAAKTNPDGNGYITIDVKGVTHFAKGVTTNDVIRAFNRAGNDSARIFHARIATSGGINRDMCHPFVSFTGQFLLMHNGIIHDALYKGTDKESDTQQLAYDIDYFMGIGRASLDRLASDNASRFLVVDRDTGSVDLFGDWSYEAGIFRSNKHHLYTQPEYTQPRRAGFTEWPFQKYQFTY